MTRKHTRTSLAAALGAAVLIAGKLSIGGQDVDRLPSTLVHRAAFVDNLVETGTISAQSMRLYASTISGGTAKIVEIAPEGRLVAPGDVLIRFDAGHLEGDLTTESAALRQAEADLVRVIKEGQIDSLRADEDVAAARQQIANAEQSLDNESNGKGRVVLAEAEHALAEADRNVLRSRATLDDLKPLLDQHFITRSEFQQAEQALQQAESDQSLAAVRRDAAVKYDRPAAAIRAQTEINSARDSLLRQIDAAKARTEQRRAAIDAATSRVQELRSRTALLNDQIGRATVRAENGGLVVYKDLYFGTDRRKPTIGDEAYPNQPILAVPDSSQLVVETRVREVDLHRVAASQHVEVTIEAYPGLRLPATVALVGALAQDDTARAGTKYFALTVKLTDTDPRLRPGMTARVDIQVASIASALVVPALAVFEQDGHPFVAKVRNGRVERQPVVLAGRTEILVAIASGVADGDRVLLVNPPQ